jgi:hypothetical protein
MSTEEALARVNAPFTAEQVESLNGYQHSIAGHPFTCPRQHREGGAHVLVASEDGWECRGFLRTIPCDFRQFWAHGFMADGSWRQMSAAIEDAPGLPRAGTVESERGMGHVLLPPILAGDIPEAALKAAFAADLTGGRALGAAVVHQAQTLECARIELIQGHPEAALEWILNGTPDVSDGVEWDGKESAREWLERAEKADG